MNGADGKPFKTRAGGVMKLYDLIAMATVEAKSRLAEQGLGADYSPERTRDIARTGRHRHHQIRRSLQSPHHGLYLRPGAVFQIRRQDRALSAICGGAHPVHPAQGARAKGMHRPRPPSIRRKNARWCCSFCRWATPWRRRKTSARPTSCAIMPSPGAEFQPLLCRPSHPVRNGHGAARPRGWGFVPATLERFDPDSGPSGHRGSRKNVSKSRGLRLRV